jgi:hypothetical protein
MNIEGNVFVSTYHVQPKWCNQVDLKNVKLYIINSEKNDVAYSAVPFKI